LSIAKQKVFNGQNVDLLPLQRNDSVLPIACYGCTVCCLAIRETKNTYSSTQEVDQMLATNPEVKKPSGVSRVRWHDNINMICKRQSIESVQLADDGFH